MRFVVGGDMHTNKIKLFLNTKSRRFSTSGSPVPGLSSALELIMYLLKGKYVSFYRHADSLQLIHSTELTATKLQDLKYSNRTSKEQIYLLVVTKNVTSVL